MWRVRVWFILVAILAAEPITKISAAEPPPFARAPSPEPIRLAPSSSRSPPPLDDGRLERLPPVEASVRKAEFVAPAGRPAYVTRATAQQSVRGTLREPEPVPAKIAVEPGAFPIDLPTALRLADANNLQVAVAREQVNQALAQVDKAKALWLPSVQSGANYDRHEGAIQRVEGVQILDSRGAYYAGLGAGGYGAASPTIPGLYANFALADALFQPLAAKQFAGSRDRAATAATNDTLLQVSLAYFELVRAGEEVAISQMTRSDAQQLVDITTAYADTGQGLASDANRARADFAVRLNDVQRAREAQRVASARLAQLLRLDPTVVLQPTDPMIAPIELVSPDAIVKELVTQGLLQRPELAENRMLVSEAVVRLRRERMAVLLPSFVMGVSYGGMGAGVNAQLAPFQDRLDVDTIAYWQLRNFGFGEAAARRAAQSNVRATQFRQLAVMDQVAREVVEAHSQVQSRKGQMANARLGIEAALAGQQQNVDRIQQAKGLPIEVLQSIQALAQARREYLRTVIDYNTAQFTLYRALGWPIQSPSNLPPKPGP